MPAGNTRPSRLTTQSCVFWIGCPIGVVAPGGAAAIA